MSILVSLEEKTFFEKAFCALKKYPTAFSYFTCVWGGYLIEALVENSLKVTFFALSFMVTLF